MRSQREPAAGQPGQGHADHASDHSAVKTVARVFGFLRTALHPACEAAGLIRYGQIFMGKRLAGAQQFHYSLAQLHTRGPGLVNAGAGEHVG